jgi:hypothetical protein
MAARRRRYLDLYDLLDSRATVWLAAAIWLVALAILTAQAVPAKNPLPLLKYFMRACFHVVDPIQVLGREWGLFLLPAAVLALLVIGPLRRRPLYALALGAAYVSGAALAYYLRYSAVL